MSALLNDIKEVKAQKPNDPVLTSLDGSMRGIVDLQGVVLAVVEKAAPSQPTILQVAAHPMGYLEVACFHDFEDVPPDTPGMSYS